MRCLSQPSNAELSASRLENSPWRGPDPLVYAIDAARNELPRAPFTKCEAEGRSRESRAKDFAKGMPTVLRLWLLCVRKKQRDDPRWRYLSRKLSKTVMQRASMGVVATGTRTNGSTMAVASGGARGENERVPRLRRRLVR